MWNWLFYFLVLWNGSIQCKQGIEKCRCTEKWCEAYEKNIQKEYLQAFLKQRGVWQILLGIWWFLILLLRVLLKEENFMFVSYRESICILFFIVGIWVMFAPYFDIASRKNRNIKNTKGFR